MTTYRKADGTRGRFFGKGEVPQGATDVIRRELSTRVETFITLNEPNKKAIAHTGSGLELGGVTHPNDLFVGENAEFQLFLDGRPLSQPASVEVSQGGTRHRNQRDRINLSTDKQGLFNLSFSKAGFYLLHAEVTLPGDLDSGIDKKHASLYLTLEVFPE